MPKNRKRRIWNRNNLWKIQSNYHHGIQAEWNAIPHAIYIHRHTHTHTYDYITSMKFFYSIKAIKNLCSSIKLFPCLSLSFFVRIPFALSHRPQSFLLLNSIFVTVNCSHSLYQSMCIRVFMLNATNSKVSSKKPPHKNSFCEFHFCSSISSPKLQ